MLVQIIILVFTWKNSVSSIEMTCAQFMMISKMQKINKVNDKVNDKADDKADDVSKIYNAYSEFLWSRLQFNNHRSLQRSLLFNIFAIMWHHFLFWNSLHLLILKIIWMSLMKNGMKKWVLMLSQHQSFCLIYLELLVIKEW